MGRQSTITDAAGSRAFVYNAGLQLETETITGLYDKTITFGYETAVMIGRSKGFSTGSDYAVTYGYDTDGRFNNISWAIGNNTGTATYVFVTDSELLESLTVNNDGVDYTASYDYEEKRHLKTQVLNEYGTTVISQYDYPSNDDLGRRTAIKTTGTAFSLPVNVDVNPEESAYTPNSLNQYSRIDTQKIQETVVGTFSYDDDGNLIDWTKGMKSMQYKYDAENRLVSVAPESPSSGDKRLEFVYDYMGRRVLKKVFEYSSGSWQSQKEILFVYDGWNLVEEITRIGESDTSRYFVWGLDLSQSLQGAGGIGGLIASVDAAASKTWYYAYDANGNVGQLVDASDGSIDAHYVYDPYGNIIGSSGIMADDNPIRFSTKYFDMETGLGYWGYRYYSPELGRWVTRDPVGEEGGINLYGFVDNNGIDFFDLLGMVLVSWNKDGYAYICSSEKNFSDSINIEKPTKSKVAELFGLTVDDINKFSQNSDISIKGNDDELSACKIWVVLQPAVDKLLLALLAYSEGTPQNKQDKYAIASTVINRKNSPSYAHTVNGVIYAQTLGGGYEYNAVNGKKWNNATKPEKLGRIKEVMDWNYSVWGANKAMTEGPMSALDGATIFHSNPTYGEQGQLMPGQVLLKYWSFEYVHKEGHHYYFKLTSKKQGK